MSSEVTFATSYQDICAAAQRLEGVAVKTPLMENLALNELIGNRVLLKAEIFQHAGAFKFRGAYNRLVQLKPKQRANGVVAWSSGNHAQGIAAAARMLGINATIVMPKDSPAIKINNTRALGANIRFYDRMTESREEIGHAIAQEQGAVLVPSYDDPHVIAGQGTVGLEALAQAENIGLRPGAVLVPCGGGGLCAGVSMAIKTQRPDTDIFTVEPQFYDDTARSLASGKQKYVPAGAKSICDALLAPYPGDLTFPINRHFVKAGLSVSDEEVRKTVKFAFETLKLVVEPGGAVALAALLNGKYTPARNSVVLIILSGGNIDPAMMKECL